VALPPSSYGHFISIFARSEIVAGVWLSDRSEEERQRVDEFCASLRPIYPDERFPEVYGQTLLGLRRRRLTVAAMDLLIAVAALVDGARLVTGNLRHFSHIEKLKLLDYGEPKS
jgi:predicted nucleic acid-binding protein